MNILHSHFAAEGGLEFSLYLFAGESLSKQEHHLGDGGFAGDVVARYYSGTCEPVACIVAAVMYSAVGTLCYVQYYYSAFYGIGNCIGEPLCGRAVSGAVGFEYNTFNAWHCELVYQRLGR